MEIFEEFKAEFPRIEKEVPLKNYTTFRIGGLARYFLRTSDKKELKKIIGLVVKKNINFCIMGGGSNVLFPSDGFDGLVIVYKVENLAKEKLSIEKTKIKGDEYIIKADTTVPLSFLISELKDFSGLEWGVGIPGTLGGAINGNSGAFGGSISDSIESVSALEVKNGEVSERTFKKNECSFGYRTSIFKDNRNLIVVSAELKLFKGDEKEIQERVRENLEKRKGKHPKGFSAGSVFKNYAGRLEDSLTESFPQLKVFNEKGVIPAGLLIELCGLKGKQVGDAKISEDHANFIVNLGNASSEDVLELIELVKKSVKEKFSIDLKEEIQIFCP